MIGKILECIALKQRRRHIDGSPNFGIGPLQSAYRALQATETAMTKVASDLFTCVYYFTGCIVRNDPLLKPTTVEALAPGTRQ